MFNPALQQPALSSTVLPLDQKSSPCARMARSPEKKHFFATTTDDEILNRAQSKL
jgi:hypothetical protein